MRCSIFEWEVRYKSVADIFLLRTDNPSQLQRERGRDRNGSRDSFVIVNNFSRTWICQDPRDDIGGIVSADAGDYGIQICRLSPQSRFRKIGQIEPYRQRQGQQQECNQDTGNESVGASVFRVRLVHVWLRFGLLSLFPGLNGVVTAPAATRTLSSLHQAASDSASRRSASANRRAT